MMAYDTGRAHRRPPFPRPGLQLARTAGHDALRAMC